MPRIKKLSDIKPTKFAREYSLEIDGFVINRGDIIKIRGEHGVQFKFDSLVTNTLTGVQWIDCFEVHRGQSGTYRSFRAEKIKRIPRRRKSERRRKSSTTS